MGCAAWRFGCVRRVDTIDGVTPRRTGFCFDCSIEAVRHESCAMRLGCSKLNSLLHPSQTCVAMQLLGACSGDRRRSTTGRKYITNDEGMV